MQSSEITRYITWGVVGLFAYALVSEVSYKNKAAPPRTLSEGQDIDVAITLVSTDAKTLACSRADEIKGRHCEFSNRTDRWSKPSSTGRPPAADLLAPYKTTDDILLLVPGLFLEPALRDRLAIDPPNSNQEHIRFVANCKMHLDGKLDEIDVRWATTGPWMTQKDAWYGPVTGCWLSDG